MCIRDRNTARRIDKSSKFPTMSKDAMRIKKIGENEKVVTSILWKHNKDCSKSKEIEMNWKHQRWKRNRKTWRVNDWIKEDKAITEKLKESLRKEVKDSQNLGKRGETLKDQTPKPNKNARPQYKMANTPTIRGCCKELNQSPHIQTKKKSVKQSSIRSYDGMMTLENKRIVNTTSVPNKDK